MFKYLDRMANRVSPWYVPIALFASTSVMGIISGWISTGVEQINQYGWFGWWIACLVGASLTAVVLGSASWARYNWVYSRAQKKWAESVDTINPLEKDFRTQRILLSDLGHPITRKIFDKRLYDCEMIGPANIFVHRDILMTGMTFFDCTFFVLWPDIDKKVYPGNAVMLEKVKMYGGAIYGATFLITPELVPTFQKMDVKFSSLTGDPKIDNR